MTRELTQSAEAARRAHDYRSAWRAAVTWWFPIVGSTAAWALHLVLLTALVQESCTDSRWLVLMHVATAVTLAVTLAALALSVRMIRRAAGAGDADPRRFLGVLNVMVAAVNTLLIVVEEILVLALRTTRCG